MKTKLFRKRILSPMKNCTNVPPTTRNKRGSSFFWSVGALVGIMSLGSGQSWAQQAAILSATGASDRAVVYPDANVPGTQKLLSLPAGTSPHGIGYFGSDNALVADFANSRVFVVKISTATLVSTIDTSPDYDGTGTIAVAPNLSAALAVGNDATLNVIHGPFGPASAITQVTLPGEIRSYQTQAIVFNQAGRAFVYHTTGISVLDPPYGSIAFTIPASGNSLCGAIAISPDGNTLLSDRLSGNTVQIFHAPFSASSTSTDLTIPGGVDMTGLMVAPDGGSAIVVSAFAHQAAAIIAPFNSSSVVETLPLPAGTAGFEDVGISADSQIAILAGGSTTEPPVVIRAPFTAAGAVATNVPINGLADPTRGFGAVRFLPPGLAPGLTISKSAPATVGAGSLLTYTISYRNTGTANATNVVIHDSLPAGTTFVSAGDGGMLANGSVVFNIGTVNAGAAAKTVTFTVTVNTAEGGTVANNIYTIEADGIFPIPGPPITTSVIAPTVTPGTLLNISTRLNVLTGDNALIGGFIIGGNDPKQVILRVVGPSLGDLGVPNFLANPNLELHFPDGSVVSNNNWMDTQKAAIQATGLAPTKNLEPAILATLPPGAYTAIARGVGDTTGVALVEVYDLDTASDSRLLNISTRGFIDTGDNVMIGGFIIGPTERDDATVLVRAIGPSLTDLGVANALQDPVLELHGPNGDTITTNDNWRDTQEAEITATGLKPKKDAESATLQTLAPGNYTAIVRGVAGTTGIGLVEVYQLD